MEPIGWMVALALFVGGYEVWWKGEPEVPVVTEVGQEHSVTSEAPVFERGRFYRSEDGYYISNLTPPPLKVEGCDRPVLMADLNSPRKAEEPIEVIEVEIDCEG